MRRIIKTAVIASVFVLTSCTGGVPQNKRPLKAPGAFGISPECSALNSDKRVYKDTPFIQEYHEGYTVGEVKESNEVRSIAVDQDHNIWIATAAGAYVKASGQKKFFPVIEGEERGPAYSVKVSDDGAVWIFCSVVWGKVSLTFSKEKVLIPCISKFLIHPFKLRFFIDR